MAKSKKKERVFLGLYLDPELYNKIKSLGQTNERSASGQARLFLQQGVEHLEGSKQAA